MRACEIISTLARWRPQNRETGNEGRPDAIATAGSSDAPSTHAAPAGELHHGGGVGGRYSLHAGMVVAADGSEAAEVELVRRATPHGRRHAASTPDMKGTRVPASGVQVRVFDASGTPSWSWLPAGNRPAGPHRISRDAPIRTGSSTECLSDWCHHSNFKPCD